MPPAGSTGFVYAVDEIVCGFGMQRGSGSVGVRYYFPGETSASQVFMSLTANEEHLIYQVI